MEFLRNRKGQGAFEYILLLAGVLLIVVLAIIILRGSVLASANNSIATQSNTLTQQNNQSVTFCGGYLQAHPGVQFIVNGSIPNSSSHCWDPFTNPGAAAVPANIWPDTFR